MEKAPSRISPGFGSALTVAGQMGRLLAWIVFAIAVTPLLAAWIRVAVRLLGD